MHFINNHKYFSFHWYWLSLYAFGWFTNVFEVYLLFRKVIWSYRMHSRAKELKKASFGVFGVDITQHNLTNLVLYCIVITQHAPLFLLESWQHSILLTRHTFADSAWVWRDTPIQTKSHSFGYNSLYKT